MTEQSETVIDPHAAAPDENPLEHLGDEIADPWDDPDQSDWGNIVLGEN